MARNRWSRGWRCGLVVAATGAVSSASLPASALGALSSSGHQPLEQRVAIALGPQRTTLWAQLRVSVAQGSFAIVVPAKPLAALDWSSPAWTEALELATAPRIVPPLGESATCPGEPVSDPIHIAGDPYHTDPLVPQELVVLPDAAAVVAWALQNGMMVTADLSVGLDALPGHRFVAARFAVPTGEALTPTLRVVAPGPEATLPLVLTEAGSADLLVTVLTLAPDRAALDGPSLAIDLGALDFDAASETSNYDALRRTALAAQPAGSLLESAGRATLVGSTPIDGGAHVVAGAVTTYFERAAYYQGGSIDWAQCISEATLALSTPLPVASSCPRAALGVVDGIDACVESPTAGSTVDPERLRCGALIDDLAVALSGQDASRAWLTRHSILIEAGGPGTTRLAGSAPGAAVSPERRAASVHLDGCEGGGSTGPGTVGAGGGTSSGAGAPSNAGTVQIPVYRTDAGCGSSGEVGEVLYFIAVDTAEAEQAPDYYTEEESCGGDTSETVSAVYEAPDFDEGASESSYEGDDSGDDCGSDTSESYDSGDDCGSDTSESSGSGEDCGSDTGSGEDCGSDTGSSSGDSCGSDTGSYSGDSCGGDSSGGEGCSMGRLRRKRPRFSMLLMATVALLAPLRRARRRSAAPRLPP